ncbi:4-alpha-glucanotransferase [Kamptonema cortianum]|nr:4-alpha-glucanotransferase [Kamptonema cortianum]
MPFPRESGVLLHPTSLPGRYGVGDLGDWAYRFVDYLHSAGQKLWQVLPLGPTSYGDSPYQALSGFAGNPLLISLDRLQREGLLSAADLADVPSFPEHTVDYGWVIPYHNDKLHRAWVNFSASGDPHLRSEFITWQSANADWLDTFALYMALKDSHGGRPWVEWTEGEALRHETALAQARVRLADPIGEQKFRQWQFFRQWTDLKNYAHSKGIRLIGDIPIFVAHDSSDVWGNPELFSLDEKGYPTVIAGVPPDYFSETGQRWGNPLYRWDVMSYDGYAWWIKRLKATLAMVDYVRIDHFRGFEAYWEVPASEPTAVIGRWVPGPNIQFFHVIERALGSLPIIAEDLGVITPEVEALRDGLNLPGMKVLQFAWGSADGANSFLPHHHVPNSVVYTGTHDNNTTVGWWNDPNEVNDTIRDFLRRYLGRDIGEIHWEMIRMAEASVANTCVILFQDLLGLGAESRMNLPGRESGNWGYRALPADFDHPSRERLAELTKLYDR